MIILGQSPVSLSTIPMSDLSQKAKRFYEDHDIHKPVEAESNSESEPDSQEMSQVEKVKDLQEYLKRRRRYLKGPKEDDALVSYDQTLFAGGLQNSKGLFVDRWA